MYYDFWQLPQKLLSKNISMTLGKTFTNCKILLSGYQVLAQHIECPPNTTIIRSFDLTIDLLDRI